jgi:hypothetical protein
LEDYGKKLAAIPNNSNSVGADNNLKGSKQASLKRNFPIALERRRHIVSSCSYMDFCRHFRSLSLDAEHHGRHADQEKRTCWPLGKSAASLVSTPRLDWRKNCD